MRARRKALTKPERDAAERAAAEKVEALAFFREAGMPTRFSSSPTLSSICASLRSSVLCSFSVSPICLPTVSTGFRLLMGS